MSSLLLSLKKEMESLSLELCELVLNNDECLSIDGKYELLVDKYKNTEVKFLEQLNIIQMQKEKQLKLEEIKENISVKSMKSDVSNSSKFSLISSTTTKTTKTNLGVVDGVINKKQKKHKKNKKNKKKKKTKFVAFKKEKELSFYHSSRKDSKKEKKESLVVSSASKGCEYHSNVFEFHGNTYATTKIKVIYKKLQNSLSRFNARFDENEIKAFLLNNNGGYFSDNNIKKIHIFHSRNFVLCEITNKPLAEIKKSINILNGKKFGNYSMTVRLEQNNGKNNNPNTENTENSALFVTNFDIVKDIQVNLKNIFVRYGLLHSIKIKTDRNRNPFAIVQYRNIENAVECFDDLKNNPIEINGRYLDVNYSFF